MLGLVKHVSEVQRLQDTQGRKQHDLRGGLLGIAAASRCRSSSCSFCSFLSVDLLLRKRWPNEDFRCCDFSAIAASLSDDGEVPALGVRGLLEETISLGYEFVADVTGSNRFFRDVDLPELSLEMKPAED